MNKCVGERRSRERSPAKVTRTPSERQSWCLNWGSSCSLPGSSRDLGHQQMVTQCVSLTFGASTQPSQCLRLKPAASVRMCVFTVYAFCFNIFKCLYNNIFLNNFFKKCSKEELGGQETGVQILALPLGTCMILGTSGPSWSFSFCFCKWG